MRLHRGTAKTAVISVIAYQTKVDTYYGAGLKQRGDPIQMDPNECGGGSRGESGGEREIRFGFLLMTDRGMSANA